MQPRNHSYFENEKESFLYVRRIYVADICRGDGTFDKKKT